MANLTPLTIAQFQQELTTAYNAKASKPANTGPGSSLGAVFNAVSLLAMQLQQQVLYLNTVARLLTSSGLDVDSFLAQFNFKRNPALQAELPVTFSIPSPAGSQVLIPAGTEVQTPGGIIFVVVADTNQTAWNATLNAYVIGIGATQCTATVQALIAGSSGNVVPQTITQVLSTPNAPAPAGVSVINPNGTQSGADQETDAAVITRWLNYIIARWAVQGAIISAVSGTQPGLTFQLGDQLDPFGNNTYPQGFFSVIVNAIGQSSGPSNSILVAVTSAIEAARACGLPFTVVGPQLVIVNGTVTVRVAAGADPSTVSAAVQAAFASFINNIGMGNLAITPTTLSSGNTVCSFSKLLADLLSVSGVVTIPNGLFTLNGGTADITATYGKQLVAGTLTVTTQ